MEVVEDNTYREFLQKKAIVSNPVGKEVEPEKIHPFLYDFQADITRWALKRGRAAVFLETGMGKALRNGTMVLSDSGWKPIEKLSIGERVYGSNGKLCPILGVFPQGKQDIYEVSISDGTTIECDIKHLWAVNTKLRNWRGVPYRVLTLEDMIKEGFDDGEGYRHFLPLPLAIEYTDKILPIDPYTLGVILGDGCIRQNQITVTTNNNIISLLKVHDTCYVRYLEQVNCEVSTVGIYSLGHKHNTMTEYLRDVNLMGKLSSEKFIPDDYKYSSVEQRISLLQGLIDTDGYVSNSNVGYGSSSKQLAEDVREIVLSLGGTATINEKNHPKYQYNGEYRIGKKHYLMSVRLPSDICPFKVPYRVNRWKPFVKYFPRRAIVDARYLCHDEATCIMVDSPDKLFVTKDYVLTHNTYIQIEFAKQIGGTTLIFAPLTVGKQTIRLAKNIDAEVFPVRSIDEIRRDKINITNYEMIKHFIGAPLDVVICEESSILKSLDGRTKKILFDHFTDIPYRLCCTATPCPNDIAEIANHSQFLGIMKREDMLSSFFVHDDNNWRLRGHARRPFYKWLSSWAIAMKNPYDLGYDGSKFILPPLNIIDVTVKADNFVTGALLPGDLKGIQDRIIVRRNTHKERAVKAAEIAKSTMGQVIVWTGIHEESELVTKLIPDAVEVEGSDSMEFKEKAIFGFIEGKHRVLVTKVKIAGMGMNFQNASTMIFLGLGDSQEQYYQAIRRCWRYKQQNPVNVYIIVSDYEMEVVENVRRKEKESQEMVQELIAESKEFSTSELQKTQEKIEVFERKVYQGKDWTMRRGDCVEELKELSDNSIDLSVYSPPFLALYQYSATERDMGNSKNEKEFFDHFGFLISDLLRVTKEGRLTCCHVSQVPAMLVRDEYIGIKDFRGRCVVEFEKRGWIYQGEVVIQKNPQCLVDGTPVLTPHGWKPIEELIIGDKVIGSNGLPTTVIDIPFRGIQPLFRVTFDDGGFVDCGPKHLWSVRTSSLNPWLVLSTEEIFKRGALTPKGSFRYEIPRVKPVSFSATKEMPISPRLLGALLADGNWAGQRSVSIAKDHVLIASLPLPSGHKLTLRPGSDRAGGRTASYGIVGPSWHHNEVLVALRYFGLEPCRAWEKFIPDCYLLASVEDRKELLRGLLDGDGKISKQGAIWYRTTSKRLAEGVVFLVNSLGGLATSRKRAGSIYGDGKQGRPLWEISVRLDSQWCPFTLERKAKYWNFSRREIHRKIVSLEQRNFGSCTCISVDASNGLFVTKDFIVTHNSQAIRLHVKGLSFAQLKKDASWLRPGLADYILVFRKPGENKVPIKPDITNEQWISWAHPVWFDIRETNTLNTLEAKSDQDDRHICPLQLDVIERCIRLWSNPGEIVLSPFAGIGSEGYVALKHKRKFIGVELKALYADVSVRNLKSVENEEQAEMFA